MKKKKVCMKIETLVLIMAMIVAYFVQPEKLASAAAYAAITKNATQDEIAELCFDAEYYAKTYPEVVSVYGNDEAKLKKHWLKYGIKEGRSGSPILDLKYYLASNADLKKVYGTDYTKAYNHFLKHGYAEYRPSSKYYDGDYYRKHYSDISGYDGYALLKHYLETGVKENRYASSIAEILDTVDSYAAITKNATQDEIAELCFDAEYYAKTYPEVVSVYGNDEAKLKKHWLKYGIKEGRSGSPILDLKYYLANNAGVKKVYGTDYTKAYNHFLKYGYAEYRPSSKYYDGDYYRKHYSDISGYDGYALLKHYLKVGIAENRCASNDTAVRMNKVADLCFDATFYANNNADLKYAFGSDEAKLRSHWINYGISEGRSASAVLDLTYYINNNADLKKVYGTDYTKAYNHFLKHGYNEYRASSSLYNGDYYRKNYPDLVNLDSYQLLRHYMNYGISEGRVAGSLLKNTTSSSSSTASAYDKKVSEFINTAKWKNGASWGSSKRPTIGGGNGTGCYAYANDFIKYVYGASGSFVGTGKAFYSVSEIRSGDVIKVVNSQHWFVVLYRSGNRLTTAEGNWGSKVVVSDSAYTISGNTLYRNGKKFRTFSVGYHYR